MLDAMFSARSPGKVFFFGIALLGYGAYDIAPSSRFHCLDRYHWTGVVRIYVSTPINLLVTYHNEFFSLFTRDNATCLKTSFDEAGRYTSAQPSESIRHCSQTVGKRDAQRLIQWKKKSRLVLWQNCPRYKLVLRKHGNPLQISPRFRYFTFFFSAYRPTYHSAYVCLPIQWLQAVNIRGT